jgi:hypothetical protein
MSFDLLNPWMLAGLAGISLPVLAHLLSKKKYDIVPWGAMQFLELGRETRRRVRLEELLLLLLRILLICLIVFALTRPWASGGVFKHLVASHPRDVVIVIDGSFSMGWEEGVETPHEQAIEWAREFLNELGNGDTVALLDARDQVREVIGKPTRDLDWVREELDRLPPPSGSSNMVEACTRAVQILSRTTQLDRIVIVLTDGQARCWSTDDGNRWLRFDDLLTQPAVRPRIRMIDVTQGIHPDRSNFTVGPLRLSRELTVADFPVRISTTIGYSGGTVPVTKRVDFEVNGEKLPDRSITVQLEPEGAATVEFEHRFASTGSYLIGVSLEGDSLPGDNRSLAALSVAEALPVLLIDGDDKFDPTQSETFFARAALTPRSLTAPWVRADVVSLPNWDPRQLSRYSVAILANVERFSDEQVTALRRYVGEGGGVMFALGDRCRPGAYADLSQAGLFPAVLRDVAKADGGKESDPAVPRPGGQMGVRIDPGSLEAGWLKRFGADPEATLTDAQFDRWWSLDPQSQDEVEDPDGFRRTHPIVGARLTSGASLLISSDLGRGRVLIMASSLDADWNTLPAKPDYVPFLHEAIFFLASAGTRRNVSPGVPLLLPVDDEFPADEYAFFDPRDEPHAVKVTGSRERPLARLTDTNLPGRYTLEPKPIDSEPRFREYFVVDFDRGESDLTPLDETDLAILTAEDRMSVVTSYEELRDSLLTDASRAELWPWLLFLFLGFLIFEVWMTRRLVQGGHMADDIREPPIASTGSEEDDGIEDFEDYLEREPVRTGRSVSESTRDR